MSNQQADRLLKPATKMASGTLLSRVLGLLRDILMTTYFDRSITDAWAAAFRGLNLFRRLLSEGAVSGLVTPRYQDQSDEEKALWFGDVILSFALLGSVLSFLHFVSAEPLLRWFLSPSFFLYPLKAQAVVSMAKVMSGYFLMILLFNVFCAVLQVMGRFGWIGLAPALFNLTMILLMFVPKDWWGQSYDALSFGVLFGSILQVLCLWPVFKAAQVKPKFSLNIFRSSKALKLSLMIFPFMIASAGTQGISFINMHMVSSLGEGPVSFLYLCDRLLEFPVTIVSVSLAAVLLPHLNASQDPKGSLSNSVFWILFLSLPAAVGLAIFSDEIVFVLFHHGKFMSEDVRQTALVLRYYSVLVVTGSVFKILSQYFFHRKEISIPLFSVIASVFYLLVMNHFNPVKSLAESALQAGIAGFVLLLPILRALPRQVYAKIFSSREQLLRFGLLQLSYFLILFGLKLLIYGSFGSIEDELIGWWVGMIKLALVLAFSVALYAALAKALQIDRYDIKTILNSIKEKS